MNYFYIVFNGIFLEIMMSTFYLYGYGTFHVLKELNFDIKLMVSTGCVSFVSCKLSRAELLGA